jgi:hypothetical protein
MYTWIRATTATLTSLLSERFAADPGLSTFFSTAAGGTMTVSAGTPQEMSNDGVSGLSVWLYRIERDEHLLNQPPRRVAYDRLERRRFPVRLHYLMTPVLEIQGDGPGLEQAIVGKVLQVFHDVPLLAGALLRDDLVGSGTELGVRFEPLPLEEVTRVWDALELSYRLSVGYEVSVALLGSGDEPTRVAPVELVQTDYGVVTHVEGTP